MAVIAFEIEEIETRGDHAHIITWSPVGSGDSGAPLGMTGSARRTVQVAGTFPPGSRVEIEGTNDGTNWSTLLDSFGNQLRFNGSGITDVALLTKLIRPRVTAGSPTVSVIMLLRKEVRT